MEPTIRVAQPEDAEVIHRLICELAAYEREPNAVEATPAGLREQLAQDPAPFHCLLAEVEGAVVGFALYFYNYSTWKGRSGLYLEDLFVLPEHRRSGAGRALMKALAEVAARRGCGRMEWVVLDWNALALRFYEGLGAQRVSGWSLYRLAGSQIDRLAEGDDPGRPGGR